MFCLSLYIASMLAKQSFHEYRKTVCFIVVYWSKGWSSYSVKFIREVIAIIILLPQDL